MTERDVAHYLKLRILALGGQWRKVEWSNRRGAPDLRVWVGKKPVWVETKCEKGKLEPHQEREHARMRKFGEKVLVIWNKEQVDEHFPA